MLFSTLPEEWASVFTVTHCISEQSCDLLTVVLVWIAAVCLVAAVFPHKQTELYLVETTYVCFYWPWWKWGVSRICLCLLSCRWPTWVKLLSLGPSFCQAAQSRQWLVWWSAAPWPSNRAPALRAILCWRFGPSRCVFTTWTSTARPQ